MLSGSQFADLLKSITSLPSRIYTNVTIGSALQNLSFCVVAAMFACLPLPCFANDKEGLAIILVASAAIWSLGTVLGGRDKPNTNAIDFLVIAYACINLIAAASSHYFPESLRGLAKVSVYLIGYFLLSAQLANNWRRRMILIAALLGSSALVSIY